VDEGAEAAREVGDALGQYNRADLGLDEGARDPSDAAVEDDFESVEPGPTEFVNFTDSGRDEVEEAEEVRPGRSYAPLIVVVVVANIAILAGAAHVFMQRYNAHQTNVAAQQAASGRSAVERTIEQAVTQRLTQAGTPEREVEDPIRSRPLRCELTGILRDRNDPSQTTVHLSREHAFGLDELRDDVDRDATFILKSVFQAVPAIQKVTVVCTSRIEVDQRGLNPKTAEAFRAAVTREQHRQAKYGEFDSLKKLGAKYHERLEQVEPPKQPRPAGERW
jgi:hypothetical protein